MCILLEIPYWYNCNLLQMAVIHYYTTLALEEKVSLTQADCPNITCTTAAAACGPSCGTAIWWRAAAVADAVAAVEATAAAAAARAAWINKREWRVRLGVRQLTYVIMSFMTADLYSTGCFINYSSNSH